jgi:HK97 family phage major capsid protein
MSDTMLSVEEVRAALGVGPLEPRAAVKSEPLTYRRDVRASYFQDLVLKDRMPGAPERLRRHAQEMEVLAKDRERAARRRLDEGGFEYRVEPNTTQGTGGYFAPPAWLIQLFAPARHAQRVLADLIPASFPLPRGVQSINVPIIESSGTQVLPVANNQGQPDQDITAAAGSSNVVTLSGQADVALQLLEQSPPGAHIDWALFKDMTGSYDAQLEGQLMNGAGSASNQLTGVLNVPSQVDITFTNATPTGALLYPYLGQAVAQIGDGRLVPPEAWLMRTARWAWITTSEDTAGLPFGLPSPFFMGNTTDTPDPVGGLIGFPVFLDDAIPATFGAGGNQDQIACLRPSDLIFFEGTPQMSVDLEVLSANLGARLIYRNYAAAITSRFASGIAAIAGTGLVVQSGF